MPAHLFITLETLLIIIGCAQAVVWEVEGFQAEECDGDGSRGTWLILKSRRAPQLGLW